MLYLLLILQSLMLVTGQTLWKYELDKYPALGKDNFLKILCSPSIIGGLFIYAAATLLWFYIISTAKDKFSMVYPFGSLAYVFGVLVAMVIFKETIPVNRWIGVGLIVLGVICIARK